MAFKARFYRAAIAQIRRRKFEAMRVRVSNPKIPGEGLVFLSGRKLVARSRTRHARSE